MLLYVLVVHLFLMLNGIPLHEYPPICLLLYLLMDI